MPWEALRRAADDRRAGSAVVAASAARALAEIARTLSVDAVIDGLRVLVQGQPLMASCLRLADVVLRAAESDGPQGAARAADAYLLRLDEERAALVKHLAEHLPTEGIVVTVSASSTVIDALRSIPRLRVLCAVSEPGGEGRDAVEALRASDMDAALIPDGALAQQSARADAVVFGADALGPNALLNKTGTLAAALGARSARRTCICIASSTKLVDEAMWPLLVDASGRRLIDGIPVFEEVPLSLVTSIVSDAGKQSHRAVKRSARGASLHPRVVEWLNDS